jgi:ectoine hydroxylase-related dioxygenase (phytanoyl-CoA dioxygenase family)
MAHATAVAQGQEGLVEAYRRDGHVTVPGIFTDAEMQGAVEDAMAWVKEVLPGLDAAQRHKYVESGVGKDGMPRWIDHPVRQLPSFERLARNATLTTVVEALIGRGVDVYFSQIFFKPPEAGTPKPAHQDNFYAGPNNPEGLVTAWIALDEATVENGCLQFVDGSHRGPIYPHFAPPDQPFHLQIAQQVLDKLRLTDAPVPRGGVSFHHGGTIHRSGANRSPRWRRAAAITYVTKDTRFDDPKLNYESRMRLVIT